ncbi:MAG: ABC transporter ATP-binding protein [Clostridiales bacterium]|nr:ABC transporter ATP-binding protein [Clostridiales bacterium]
MEPILTLTNVNLTYNGVAAETHALRGVSFSVLPGEFVAIVGPSGCGKSSILSLIAGLIAPSGGAIELMGKPIEGPNAKVGYMLQRDHLFEWRTVWQNVLLGQQIRRMPASAHDCAERLLRTYGLYEFRDRRPSELSGGMRQRAALIRTLAVDPEVLLLDEPFSALDYQTRLTLCDEVAAIIRTEGKTALFVTHDIAEAISIADRVIVLTSRPARVKRDMAIDMPAGRPFARRSMPEFRGYFNEIWGELEENG